MKGKLFVLSGFSGAGKGTLVKYFLEHYEGFALSVSATTRPMREGEIDGVHYHFITRESFEEMIGRGELIEYTQYQGNYYGTPRPFVEKQLEEGVDVLLEIEVDGGTQIRKLYPDATLIFLMPPSAEELARRLRKRGTNTEEEIAGRLRRAVEESRYIGDYDYLLINDDLAECAARFERIAEVQHEKPGFLTEFTEAFTEQLKEIC